MKKLLLILLVLISFIVSGCGDSTPKATPTPEGPPKKNQSTIMAEEMNAALTAVPIKVDIEADGRPYMSGELRDYESEHFKFHYAISTLHSVPLEDVDENGVPDYIDAAAEIYETMYETVHEEYMFPVPPPDKEAGGNGKLDVYFRHLLNAGVLGMKVSSTVVFDNPNSEQEEFYASSSFMEVENDLDGDYVTERGMTHLSTIIYHEYMHAIQAGMTTLAPSWLLESNATWFEYITHEDFYNRASFRRAPFAAPDACFVEEGGDYGEPSYANQYGQYLFFLSQTNKYGNVFMSDLWKNMVTVNDSQKAFEAIDMTLQEHGNVSFEDAFDLFYIEKLIRDFKYGNEFSTVWVEGLVNGEGTFTPPTGVSNGGADYIAVNSMKPQEVTLNSDVLELTFVGIDHDFTYEAYDISDGKGLIDPTNYKFSFLIVKNTNFVNAEGQCEISDYSLDFVDADGEIPEIQWSGFAPNFYPPIDY